MEEKELESKIMKSESIMNMTIKDFQEMMDRKEVFEFLEKKVTEESKSPPVNFEPNKQLKNQDKDSNKILTIYDSKFYYPDGEKAFFRLNPFAGEQSVFTYEMFVRYCVFSDSHAMTEVEIANYDNMMKGLKKLWYKAYEKKRGRVNSNFLTCFLSTNLTNTNRYNIFVWFSVNNAQSHAFSENSCHAAIPRELLSSCDASGLLNYLIKNVKGFKDIMKVTK